MANPTTPTGVPAQVTAGDTLKWRILDPVVGPGPTFNRYSQADGWALKYDIVGAAAVHVPGTGTSTLAYQGAGDDIGYWVATVPPADSTLLVPPTGALSGRYRIIGRVVGSGAFAGQEYTVSDDVLVVLRDPRTAVAGAYQTNTEKILALLDLEIAARISGTGSAHDSYQISGRALNKVSLRDLNRMRGKYAARLLQEKSGRMGQQVAVEFSRAGRSTSPSADWLGSVD